MAAVTVRLHGVFGEFAGTRSVRLEAASVAEALDRLPERAPGLRERIRDEQGRIRDHLNVFHNGVEIRPADGADPSLSDGDVVHLIPAMSGGS